MRLCVWKLRKPEALLPVARQRLADFPSASDRPLTGRWRSNDKQSVCILSRHRFLLEVDRRQNVEASLVSRTIGALSASFSIFASCAEEKANNDIDSLSLSLVILVAFGEILKNRN